MKLSTARKLVCMSYFTQSTKMRDELATATRIVHSADTTRYLFPDGSVIESTKGNWKVVGMEKNPKLEAAVKRFGKSGGYTGAPKDQIAGVVAAGHYTFKGTDAERRAWLNSGTNKTFEDWKVGELLACGEVSVNETRRFTREEICEHFAVPIVSESLTAQSKAQRLEWHVAELQKMLNEKDEQLDNASRPMVVRLDWWAVALVAVVLVAHYVFKVL